MKVEQIIVEMEKVWKYMMKKKIGKVNEMMGMIGIEGNKWLG